MWCSFLDNEEIREHERYVGERISRGLFRSSKGIIINADVNSAYNIIRKEFPEFSVLSLEKVELHPIRHIITTKKIRKRNSRNSIKKDGIEVEGRGHRDTFNSIA